ncbi:MAG: hypothetical protein FWE76_08930 [Symbiobacteriaceae bacterium]|nr:hypothetical protein [Symbiobacteriaceae bacterium]
MPKLSKQDIIVRKMSKIRSRMQKDEQYLDLLQQQLNDLGLPEYVQTGGVRRLAPRQIRELRYDFHPGID